MGVWAASRVMGKLQETDTSLIIKNSIAINGTPYPIDDTCGIPSVIYHGTLEGLTGPSLNKFLRRMCFNGEAFKEFLNITPRRPLEELKEELAEIERMYLAQPTTSFHWQQVVVGSNDRIIPPDNQLNAWRKEEENNRKKIRVHYTEDAHYQVELFRYYLQDIWTKRLIAERFARARDTYSREARVQQQVAEKMLRLLTEHTSLFHRIVEFGCGTGSYSRLLLDKLQPESLLLNDLCPEMRECLTDLLPQNMVQFIPGDAEALDFPEGTDLITSCSTLQWFNDPEAFFARCHRFLSEEGYLAFSTFGAENMREIHTLTGHGLEYLSIETLKELLAPHFETVYAEEEIVSLPFNTPLQVLQHLKETGVTGTEKKVWTRGRLQTFCNGYTEQFSREDGNVTLTYHPIYIVTRKKNK